METCYCIYMPIIVQQGTEAVKKMNLPLEQLESLTLPEMTLLKSGDTKCVKCSVQIA